MSQTKTSPFPVSPTTSSAFFIPSHNVLYKPTASRLLPQMATFLILHTFFEWSYSCFSFQLPLLCWRFLTPYLSLIDLFWTFHIHVSQILRFQCPKVNLLSFQKYVPSLCLCTTIHQSPKPKMCESTLPLPTVCTFHHLQVQGIFNT